MMVELLAPASASGAVRCGSGPLRLGLAYPRARRRPHLLRQIVLQLAHRIRAARFRQHFHGAILQSFESRLARGLRERTDHDHRQRIELHQFLEKRQAVHARHLDIQRQDVRAQADDLVSRNIRIRGRAHYLQIRLRRQGFAQQPADDGRIVDDQHPDFARGVHCISLSVGGRRHGWNQANRYRKQPFWNCEAVVQRSRGRPLLPGCQLGRG